MAGLPGLRPADARVRELTDAPRRGDGTVDLDAIVRCLRSRGRVHVLETRQGVPAAGHVSYVVPDAGVRVEDDGETTRLVSPRGQVVLGSDPFACIDDLTRAIGLSPDDPPGPYPFSGGLVGAFSYDLSRRVERLPTRAVDDRSHPHLVLHLAPVVVVVDHRDETAHLVHRPILAEDTDDLADSVLRVLAEPPPPLPRVVVPAQLAVTSLPAPAYRSRVRDILDDIAAGETFQVNLSQRISAQWPADVHALYRAMRDRSPAPYGAVIEGPVDIASISPETFLEATGRHVRTRPIKGTRPRGGTAAEDERLRAELTSSEKDAAENVMVVDMERNDLGRVAEIGSVRVPSLLEVEGHPTVWHLVSTVEATLADGVGWGGLLRAAFPCGSVTGTPKVRAMELIDGYEPVRRGYYCGALGYISAGALGTSVTIRTAVLLPDGTVDYGAGGGVVADSDPAGEHEESIAKAQAFLDAVGAFGLR